MRIHLLIEKTLYIIQNWFPVLPADKKKYNKNPGRGILILLTPSCM